MGYGPELIPLWPTDEPVYMPEDQVAPSMKLALGGAE